MNKIKNILMLIGGIVLAIFVVTFVVHTIAGFMLLRAYVDHYSL